jgi:hypothetical protein
MGDKVAKQSSSLSATSSHGSDFMTPNPTASSQRNQDPLSDVGSKMDMQLVRLSFNDDKMPSTSSKSNAKSTAEVVGQITPAATNGGDDKIASVAVPFTPVINAKANKDSAVKSNASESFSPLLSPTAAMASQSTTVKRLEDVFLKHQPAGSTFVKTALDKYVRDAISTHRGNIGSAYEPLMRSMEQCILEHTDLPSNIFAAKPKLKYIGGCIDAVELVMCALRGCENREESIQEVVPGFIQSIQEQFENIVFEVSNVTYLVSQFNEYLTTSLNSTGDTSENEVLEKNKHKKNKKHKKEKKEKREKN